MWQFFYADRAKIRCNQRLPPLCTTICTAVAKMKARNACILLFCLIYAKVGGDEDATEAEGEFMVKRVQQPPANATIEGGPEAALQPPRVSIMVDAECSKGYARDATGDCVEVF